MKNIIFIFGLINLFYIYNCGKPGLVGHIIEDPVDSVVVPVDTPLIHLGKAYVLKNGIDWEAPFEAWYYHADSVFQLRADITYSNLRGEHFFLTDIPCKAGKYPVEYFRYSNWQNQTPEAGFRITQDYDQGVGNYYTDSTRTDHYIEVLRYDAKQKTVEGRFQLFFGKRASGGFQWPDVPDSIFLTEGKFHLNVKKP